jgi:hypothetical protein
MKSSIDSLFFGLLRDVVSTLWFRFIVNRERVDNDRSGRNNTCTGVRFHGQSR